MFANMTCEPADSPLYSRVSQILCGGNHHQPDIPLMSRHRFWARYTVCGSRIGLGNLQLAQIPRGFSAAALRGCQPHPHCFPC